jgi:cytochrome c peroxidase
MRLILSLMWAAAIPSPVGNPLTAEKAALGRELFFERRLSADGSISCAGCHDQRRAFTDGRTSARGVHRRTGTRNTPSLVNRAWGGSQFWDGRADTLEQQVLMPLQDPKEMNMTLEAAVARLRANSGYRTKFLALFHREACAEDLAMAIASYVRTIRSEDSRYDRFLRGEVKFTEEELLGLNLFSGKANCHICHGGTNLTDEAFHNTGVAWRDGRLADEGRFAVTHEPYHHGAFKTPSLREAPRTAPYMHDGSLKTLEDVVEFYDRGGRKNPYLDANMIGELRLTGAEKAALVKFLRTLSGEVREGL